MQFFPRVLILAVALFGVVFLFGFWPVPEVEDSNAKLLRRVTELEARIRSHQDLLLYVKKGIASVGDGNGRRGSSGALSKVFDLKRLKLANIYDALPHLLEYEEALVPALTLGRDREGVSMVIGIPTVKRPTQSYLLNTLQNLLGSMSPAERNDTLIIVFIAEFDVSFVETTVNAISRQFKEDVESGLIEIVAPSASFYPDLKTIKSTLGDSEERTRWRTKQNLDYVYLMMYAQKRGMYYVQLEDDVLSKKGFVTTMKDFALTKSTENDEWYMLDFCQLGFIGKLFKSEELWKLVEFILLFYQDKPVDWLLSHFFSVRYCKLDYTHKRCLKELEKHWIHYKPSLFQHIGMISSLSGKVQKLKDRQFGKLELFTRHSNPPATVESSIKHYGKFSLEKAYKGINFYWGLAPQAGDTILFTFEKPLCVKRYRVVSGNAEHPFDKLRNATLEIKTSKRDKKYIEKEDGFLVIEEFDDMGRVDGHIEEQLCPVEAVRIFLKDSSDFWIILSEILLEAA